MSRDIRDLAKKEANPQSAIVRRILKKGIDELKKG
jgi:hypothetical protein